VKSGLQKDEFTGEETTEKETAMSPWWMKDDDNPDENAPPAHQPYQPPTAETAEAPATTATEEVEPTPRIDAEPQTERTDAPPAVKIQPAMASMGGRPRSDAGASLTDDASVGRLIDEALGEFNRQLASLENEMKTKQAEIADIQRQITKVQKEEVKAFKRLVGKNPQIKKMMGPKKAGTRRRKAAARGR